ncbi:MAG TPA: CapA family protein [Terriglobia bacterium]|nr:CapA family protein [Terriglobia bacterium]
MMKLRTLALAGVILAGSALLPPAARAQETAEPPPPRELTLLFVGDVMLSRGVGAKMASEGDWTFPFLKITDTLREADLTFGNLECPVSDVGRNRHHLYSFRADPRVIEGLTFAGFDVVSVANNHSYDWGPDALLDTLRRLREAGIQPVGAGADDLEAHYPVLVEVEGVKLAFLAYVNVEPKAATAGPEKPGVAWLDPERVLADIRFARPLADVVIVSLHWGNEYATRQQPEQVELARQMIDAGADLIVGGHPHVVQPLETYAGRWIAYSLGNFVFDQKASATHSGIMLRVTISNREITDVAPVPITIGRTTFQAELTPPKKLPRDKTLPSGETAARGIPAQ